MQIQNYHQIMQQWERMHNADNSPVKQKAQKGTTKLHKSDALDYGSIVGLRPNCSIVKAGQGIPQPDKKHKVKEPRSPYSYHNGTQKSYTTL